jgi:hypothetical protein
MSIRINAPVWAEITADISDFKRGYLKGVRNAFRTTSRLAREWRDKYFPVDTGNLIGMTTIGIDFSGPPFRIMLRVDVDYASFVNLMEGVRWTNRLTVDHFFDVWTRLVRKWFHDALVEEIFAVGNALTTLQLSTESYENIDPLALIEMGGT